MIAAHDPGRSRVHSAEAVSAEISAHVDTIFASISRIADAASMLWRVSPQARAADVAALRPVILDQLSAHPEFHGCGFVAAVNVLQDRDRHWEWFVRDAIDHHPRSLRLRGNDGGETYAYELLEGYRRAAAGKDSVTGPFLDFAGADRLIVSAYRPVVLGDTFVGLAGADLLVSAFESLVRPALRSCASPLALLNSAGRVVASTSADLELLERVPSERSCARYEIAPGTADWTLIEVTPAS